VRKELKKQSRLGNAEKDPGALHSEEPARVSASGTSALYNKSGGSDRETLKENLHRFCGAGREDVTLTTAGDRFGDKKYFSEAGSTIS
jgi:hypothetical protein